MNVIAISPLVLLTLYCLVVFLAALAGGWLPALFQLTHSRLQTAISFVGGLMLGLAVLGMLPHALEHLGAPAVALRWLLAGFLGMFLLQRFLPFHHHDVAEGSPVEPCGHTHSLAERGARNLSWAGVAAGNQTNCGALGLGTALAVILHKPFGALAISTLMVASHTSKRSRRWVNLGFAAVTPLGALLFSVGAGHLAHSHPAWVGAALAFCAGTFLCIACADLLPELQFHSHDRLKLSVALLLGLATAALIVSYGHAGPESHHSDAPPGHARTSRFVTFVMLAAQSPMAEEKLY